MSGMTPDARGIAATVASGSSPKHEALASDSGRLTTSLSLGGHRFCAMAARRERTSEARVSRPDLGFATSASCAPAAKPLRR